MHSGLKIAMRVVMTTVAGLVGLLCGGFLGLAFASLIMGGGLHGLGTNAIIFFCAGGLVGIVVGTKLGNSFGRRLR